MIWYFWEGLRPLVRVKIKQYGRELNSFEETVEKAVNVKAKAALRPRSYTRNTDQHYLQGSQLLVAKTSTQDQPMKDSRIEEPKPKSQEQKASAPQRSNRAETPKQAWKEKKKKEKQERSN